MEKSYSDLELMNGNLRDYVERLEEELCDLNDSYEELAEEYYELKEKYSSLCIFVKALRNGHEQVFDWIDERDLIEESDVDGEEFLELEDEDESPIRDFTKKFLN